VSLKPTPVPDVLELTARVARAAFPKGNPYLRLRDELGTLFRDAGFADLYPRRGQPALPPWKLALVTVMQFAEDLSDRQAAEAVRGRIDWKYALGLELDDPGFNFSVLSEFRGRLVAGGSETLALVSRWRWCPLALVSDLFSATLTPAVPAYLARVGPTTPKQFGAGYRMCPHLAVRTPPDGSLSARAAELCVAIRCFLDGDSLRETEMAEAALHPPPARPYIQIWPCFPSPIPISIGEAAPGTTNPATRRASWISSIQTLPRQPPALPERPACKSTRSKVTFLFPTYKRSNGPGRQGSDRGFDPAQIPLKGELPRWRNSSRSAEARPGGRAT
jgi:transposase